MNKFFELGDRYAEESTWKDFALVKFCLFAMGIIIGALLPKKVRKPAIIGGSAVFLLTYIPLMTKVVKIIFRMKGETAEKSEEETEE